MSLAARFRYYDGLHDVTKPKVEKYGKWTAFRGPKGGRGWKNSSTGEVVYQQEKPGEEGEEEPQGGPGRKPPSAQAKAQAAMSDPKVLEQWKNLDPEQLKQVAERGNDFQKMMAKNLLGQGEGEKPQAGGSDINPLKEGEDLVQHQEEEPKTAPPPGEFYDPDPAEGKAARVGVPGDATPPPPKVPRLPNLNPQERRVEESFASAYEADPDKYVDKLIEEMAAGRVGDDVNIFATDEAKMLDSTWFNDNTYEKNPDGTLKLNDKGKPILTDEAKSNRGLYNTALHQTANAIAKKAFEKYVIEKVASLPEGDPRRTILVTAGGVAAGKGYAIENAPEVAEKQSLAGAVWDSAGEQNSTEMAWVQAIAEKHNIPTAYAFVHADPTGTWGNPKRGVMQRAAEKGRMVDARVYSDSYDLGAKNFQKWADSVQGNPLHEVFYLDNNRGATPERVPAMPESALTQDREKIYAASLEALKTAPVPDYVKEGGSAGARIWGRPKTNIF